MLYLWTQNYSQIIGTCPGHHGQLISQNCVVTKIRAASSGKDFGVIVNTTLTFDDQCNDRYSTMNQKLGLLWRVCYFTKDQKQNEHYFWL